MKYQNGRRMADKTGHHSGLAIALTPLAVPQDVSQVAVLLGVFGCLVRTVTMGELIANIPVENLVYYGPEPTFDYLDKMTADVKAMARPEWWPVITVRRIGKDKYEIINGIQRFRACVQAGITTVSIDVHDLFDHQVKIAQMLSSWEYIPTTKEEIAKIQDRLDRRRAGGLDPYP